VSRRLLTNLAAAVSLSVRKPLAVAGLIMQPCGWRRVTGIGLKSVGSKFALAAFGLDSGYDGTRFSVAANHVWDAIANVVFAEKTWSLHVVERRGCCIGIPAVDSLPCTFHAEPISDPTLRFAPPELCCANHSGQQLLNFVCRLSADLRTVDIWMQVHHAAADGAPMQELIGRLKQSLGVHESVTFPTPEQWRPHAQPTPWHRPGDRPIEHALDFLDFEPLLESRRQINARRESAGLKPATVGAALVWRLSQHAHLRGKKFAVTVDIAATEKEPRCVDLVVTRPAEFDEVDPFLDDFNAQIVACRERRSPTRRAMRAIALLPPRRAMSLLRLNAERTRETFGTVGLSLLRETDVFIAPMSDPGFDDGFLAIGRMDLPTSDGRSVGAASAKGDAGKPAQLLAALRDVLDRKS
jgi:hypothetical protein